METEQQLFKYDNEHESSLQIVEEIYFNASSKLNKIESVRRPSTQCNLRAPFESTSINNTGIAYGGRPQSSEGNYIEWQSFFQLFMKKVDERPELSNAEKLQFLRGALQGEAEKLIKHMPITDECYSEALEKLKNRYNKKRYTINAYIQKFMEQPTVTQASVPMIKKLYDTSDGVIRGLKALGESSESRDIWLIYIVLSKLDNESSSLWARETKNEEHPTIKQLFSFLGDRVDALETFGMSNPKSSTSNTAFQPPRMTKLHAIMADFWQTLCKSEDSHRLQDCPNFVKLNKPNRILYIKEEGRGFNCLYKAHSVYQCRSNSRCRICRRRHHTMLHEHQSRETSSQSHNGLQSSTPDAINNNNSEETSSSKREANEEKSITNAHIEIDQTLNAYSSELRTSPKTSYPKNTQLTSLLPTALVKVKHYNGNQHIFRALLDSGSESNFVTTRCINQLKLIASRDSIGIRGLGHSNVGRTRGSVQMELSNTDETYSTKIWSYVVPKVSYSIAKNTTIHRDRKMLGKINLADPSLFEAGEIDILLGVNIFFEVLESGEKIESEELAAHKTKFGWIVVGSANSKTNLEPNTLNTSIDPSACLNESLYKFWEIESIPAATILSPEEEDCEALFSSTTTRGNDGKFVVRLPFKDNANQLGSSYQLAFSRLRAMERRFQSDKIFKDMYFAFMVEYEALGHMTIIGEADKTAYILPHHGVMKESTTTKIRVVFDASAKSKNNISLNEMLKIGPTVQSSLAEILLRFRQHQFVFTGDVEKMYRMIWVHQEDARYKNILWRRSPAETPKQYRLNTVTYGIGPSAFLATRSLKKAALHIRRISESASKVIQRDVYVDDLMAGTSSETELLRLKDEIQIQLKSFGFNMRKLRSNINKEINEHADASNINLTTAETKQICQDEARKVLGLVWNSYHDELSFQFQPNEIPILTKRSLLSEASKIFDPLGLLSSIIIKIKIIFQKLWLEPIGWDDELPDSVKSDWWKIKDSCHRIGQIKIPRWIHISNNVNYSVILHGFGDASESAYVACVYAVTNFNGVSTSRLVVTKSKVAPISQNSLPRLELLAAFLLAKLTSWVEATLTMKAKQVILWTDSTIVLDWLFSHPRRWQTFIQNRTAQILDTYKYSREHWRHIRSEENPADCASRGIYLDELMEHELWWTGPAWLISDFNQTSSNAEIIINPQDLGSIALNCIVAQDFLEHLIQNHVTFYSACHALAMARKYIQILKAMIRPELMKEFDPVIHPSDIHRAERLLCMHVQQTMFAKECESLSKGSLVAKQSGIRSLNPFLHHDGLIRVGGRIDKSTSSFLVKHPIILPSCKLSKLIIYDYHLSFQHSGITLTLAMVRRKFWIIHCKNGIRSIIYHCIKCTKANPRLKQQMMGDLPSVRLQYEHALANVATDYCGPFSAHIVRRRGATPIKVYVCLFVCMASKAVHFEVVGNLTTDNFVAALQRFICRRGICRSIYSDNGANYVGARNKFQQVYDFLRDNISEINAFLLKNQICWHFIPAGAPHIGGLWEAFVKLLKTSLYKTMGNHILTLEEFQTLIVRIEAAVISRPICINEREEVDALTPAHFIIGRALADIPQPIAVNTVSRWHTTQQIYTHFWRKWQGNYATALQSRYKWHEAKYNLKVGDIVLMAGEKSTSLQWPLARVVAIHRGEDGLVRVVTLKVARTNTTISRPIHKVCKLPIIEDEEILNQEDSGRAECCDR